MKWTNPIPTIAKLIAAPFQVQNSRMTDHSAAASTAIARYHNPNKGSKYPHTLHHLPFRTRPMTQAAYDNVHSAQRRIGYEEIENLLAVDAGTQSPFGFWYIIHPLSRAQVRRFNTQVLNLLKAWIESKDIYVGDDTQLKMFIEARKETLEAVAREIFKRECAQVESVPDTCEWPVELVDEGWELIDVEDC